MQKKIIDYKEGEKIEGHFLIQNAQVKVTSKNSPYLDCVITDNSASVSSKLWSIPIEMDVEAIKESDFVYLTGTIEIYKDNPQIRIGFIRPVYQDEKFEKRELVPIVDDPIGLFREIVETVKGVPDDDIRNLLQKIIVDNKEDIIKSPAAKSVHHSKIGGLALHICEMLRVAKALIDIFPIVNKSYLIAGVILHDIGKIKEMKRNSIGLVEDYTAQGKLIGHIVLATLYINEVGKELSVPEEKIMMLEHLILSHHGEPEFGSPKPPMSLEAEFLHYCDMISSRADIYREALKDVEKGSFASKIYALGIEPYNPA